jgi:hypothetical protein
VSDIPPDLTPQETPAYRAAKLAVIILSGLIILAVIALIVGGIAGLGKKKPPASGEAATFQLAPGARILSMDSQPGRLILRIRTQTGEEIDILDTQNGHLVGQVKATFSDKAH